ncbi:MAG: ArsR family transcriptional regulator [Candidatus Melainabacteria bacterium]|nr:MAG: ArsR family transcriptional regulator [Candidatus Melainabacteria bacterium]
MQDSLSLTFSALADPTRRAMLAQLKNGEASVTDLAKPYGMSLPAITKHIKVLEKAGLITKSREAQWRPCRLKEDGLREAADWMEEYRAYWEASLDRLEAYLKTVTTEQKPVVRKSKRNSSAEKNTITAKAKAPAGRRKKGERDARKEEI